MTRENRSLDYRPPVEMEEKVEAICKKILDCIVPKCNALGWCISVHGSLKRDLDIVAVPWTDEAISTPDLLVAILGFIKEEFGWSGGYTILKDRPHGRRTSCFYLGGEDLVECEAGAFPYIDISILDLRQFL